MSELPEHDHHDDPSPRRSTPGAARSGACSLSSSRRRKETIRSPKSLPEDRRRRLTWRRASRSRSTTTPLRDRPSHLARPGPRRARYCCWSSWRGCCASVSPSSGWPGWLGTVTGWRPTSAGDPDRRHRDCPAIRSGRREHGSGPFRAGDRALRVDCRDGPAPGALPGRQPGAASGGAHRDRRDAGPDCHADRSRYRYADPGPIADAHPGSLTATQATAAPDPADPAYLYDEAARAMRLSRYEEATSGCARFRRSKSESPPGRDARDADGGADAPGTDLPARRERRRRRPAARGILLIYEADDLGTVEPQSLLYEADVAERYLNARSYVNGGNYAQAIAILEQLCAEAESTCNWGYRGVSVRDLLERARAAGPPPGEIGS